MQLIHSFFFFFLKNIQLQLDTFRAYIFKTFDVLVGEKKLLIVYDWRNILMKEIR